MPTLNDWCVCLKWNDKWNIYIYVEISDGNKQEIYHRNFSI